MTTEFGWTRTEFALATTFLTWSGALSMPFIGRFADKVGVKPLLLVGTLLMGLVTLAMSRQTASLPMLYGFYAVMGLSSATYIAYSKVISALFARNRGKMLALFGIESMVLGAVVPLMTAYIMEAYGWRTLYLVFGVMILSIAPLILFGLQEPGVDRAKAADAARKVLPAAPQMEGLTIAQILRTQPFWVMMAVSVLALAPSAGIGLQIVPYIQSKGFSPMVAGTYMAASMVLGIVGAALAGWAMDRFATAKVAAPFYLISALSTVGLILVNSTMGGLPLLYFVSCLGGFAMASIRPMNTYFHTRFFGLRAFTEIHGVERAILAVATGLSAPGFAMLYDRTKSYDLLFGILVVTGTLCALGYLMIGPYRYAADVGLAKPEEPSPSGLAGAGRKPAAAAATPAE